MRPDPDATAAVLIGSRRYRAEIGDELPGAAWSVHSFGHLLTTPRFGLPRSAIEVIGDDETRDPSTLRTHLKSFAQAARDTTLIYFVGHGQTTGDRKELYLQLPDTTGEDIHESSLRFSEIWESLMNSETRLKIAILDCCFAGVALDRPLLESVRRRTAEGAGCFLAASVSGESTAFAPLESVHTAYSAHLIDVLDSGFPSDQPTLGLNQVFDEVSRRCVDAGLPRPLTLPYLTDADVEFMRNPRWLREPSSEDAFMDLYSEVDRWIGSLRRVGGVGFSPRVISDLRRLTNTAYAELDRVGIRIEADPQADWSPEAIESCVAATDMIDDLIRRYLDTSRAAARRRREAMRGYETGLRGLDEDNAVVVALRRRLIDGLTDLRSGLRALARAPSA